MRHSISAGSRQFAEVTVGGLPAGVRLARPFRFDLTGLVHKGANRIEVKVANTLANHIEHVSNKMGVRGADRVRTARSDRG